jgi:hypothetical protein
MRRFDSSSVIRQRMHRLKKRKTILRRQQSLREKMLLTKPEDQLVDMQEVLDGTESVTEQDQ